MAWWESAKSQLNTSGERSFIADDESDVANLPTSEDYPGGLIPGSDCMIIGSGNVYILDSTRNWSPIGG